MGCRGELEHLILEHKDSMVLDEWQYHAYKPMHCIQPFLSVQTGKITAENRIHDLDIKDMRFSRDGTHFITASGDRTSKIVDAQDLTVMKEFAFERPANAADMSPIADHVRRYSL